MVVRVRKQCLKQGLSVTVLLSTEWWQLQNETPFTPPVDPVLGEGQMGWRPPLPLPKLRFPSLRQVPSAAPSPSPAFLPSQHHSHKSSVKCCISAHENNVSRTTCSSCLTEALCWTFKIFLAPCDDQSRVRLQFWFWVLKQLSPSLMLP